MRNAITTFSSTKHDDLKYQRYAQYIDEEKRVYTMANEDERNLHYLAYLIVILEDLKYNFDWDQDSFDELNTNIPKILSSIIDQQQTLLALSTSKQIITFLYSVNKMSNHWAIYAFQDEIGELEPAAEIILNQLYDIYYSNYMSLKSLLDANVLDNSNGGNNSNTSTESSSMGSSE